MARTLQSCYNITEMFRAAWIGEKTHHAAFYFTLCGFLFMRIASI